MHSATLLPPPAQGIWGGDEKAVTSEKTSNPPNSHAWDPFWSQSSAEQTTSA